MDELIAKHRRHGLLVDTNVLLLHLIGSVSLTVIGRHKRTQVFTPRDYEVLDGLLRRFERVVVTPGILAETSNLAGQIADPDREEIFIAFRKIIPLVRERHVEAIRIAEEVSFLPFGITDAGISIAARKGYLVLTDDFPLYMSLLSAGHDVINFNHLRRIG